MALQVIASFAALAAVIGVGVAVFVWARHQWRRQRDEEPTIPDQLAAFRHLRDQGLLDSQEFERIQARLEGRPDTSSTGIQAGPPPRPTDLRSGPPPAPPFDAHP